MWGWSDKNTPRPHNPKMKLEKILSVLLVSSTICFDSCSRIIYPKINIDVNKLMNSETRKKELYDIKNKLLRYEDLNLDDYESDTIKKDTIK